MPKQYIENLLELHSMDKAKNPADVALGTFIGRF